MTVMRMVSSGPNGRALDRGQLAEGMPHAADTCGVEKSDPVQQVGGGVEGARVLLPRCENLVGGGGGARSEPLDGAPQAVNGAGLRTPAEFSVRDLDVGTAPSRIV